MLYGDTPPDAVRVEEKYCPTIPFNSFSVVMIDGGPFGDIVCKKSASEFPSADQPVTDESHLIYHHVYPFATAEHDDPAGLGLVVGGQPV
jgi:hypothetical protein